jgi:tRNA A37 threonylcarbamoyladenosine modification protein TsaB
VNAERGQVFAGRYAVTGRAALAPICDVQILDMASWQESLQPGDLVTGPALAKLTLQFPDPIQRADASVWQPHAQTVGELAWRDYANGRRDDVWQIVPQYHRLSAAEEKRKE